MNGRIFVKNPGPLTTVQDLGRTGYQRYGIPPSGAMDPYAFQAANILAGNGRNVPGLEITLSGLCLEFGRSCSLGLAGADLGAFLNGFPIKTWSSFRAKTGDVLKFTERKNGCRAYLAFGGGIAVPEMLGSSSTYLIGRFGGFKGRKLQRGDELSSGSTVPGFRYFEAPEGLTPGYRNFSKIRVIPGPQDDFFTEDEIEKFLSSKFTVTSESDRMGYRLDGPEIKRIAGAEMVSDGVTTGSIQIPGNGKPVVMMADHQTTGGYPKIANVISADLQFVAQAVPGDVFVFERTDIGTAREFYTGLNKRLSELQKLTDLEFKGKRYIVKVNGREFNVSIKEI